MSFINSKHSWLILLLCLFENLIFSGYVGGWNLFTELYRGEVYTENCPKDSLSNCTLQNNKFELILTLCTIFRGLAVLLIPFFLEKWGIRVTKTLASIQIGVGSLFLVLCGTETPHFFFIGSLLISTGGGQLFFANLTTAEIFTRTKLSVMALHSGALFSSSLFVPYMYKEFSKRVITKNMVSAIWGIASLISILTTWVFFSPRNPVGFNIRLSEIGILPENTMRTGTTKNGGYSLLTDQESFATNTEPQISVRNAMTSSTAKTQISHLLSIPYMMFVGWSCSNYLCLCLYEAVFESRMDKDFKIENLFSSYAFAIIFSSLCSLIVIPSLSLLLDYTTQLEKDKRRCCGLFLLVQTSFIIAAASFYQRFTTFRALQISLVFFESARALHLAVALIYIRFRFPKEEFLFLVAIQMLVTTLFGKLRYPLIIFYHEFPVTAISAVASVHFLFMLILIIVFFPKSYMQKAFASIKSNVVVPVKEV